MSTVTIRYGESDDAEQLAKLAARTFRETYEGDTDPGRMAAYLADHFRPEHAIAALADPRRVHLLAEEEGTLVGFASLDTAATDSPVEARRPVLLGEIYVRRDRIGSGLGSRLLERCLEEAAARGHDVIWLGVWERNPRAIAFYERWGFRRVGETTFDFAGETHRDLLYARPVQSRDAPDR